MPHAQSTLSRQLLSSTQFVQSLPASHSPYSIAQQIVAIRERQIERMAKIIADESEHLANSTTWRDAFCYECEHNECALGTARDLATKLFDAGWVADRRLPRLECLACQGGE